LEILNYLEKALEIKVAYVIVGGAIIVVSIQTLKDQGLFVGIAIGVAFATVIPLGLWLWGYLHRVKPLIISIPRQGSPLWQSIVDNPIKCSKFSVSSGGNFLTGYYLTISFTVKNPNKILLDGLDIRFDIINLDSARELMRLEELADLAPNETDSYRIRLGLGRTKGRYKGICIFRRQRVEIGRTHFTL